MDVTELRQLIAAELAEVHTCMPGKIVSYDGNSATVRPALPKKLANGEILQAPTIVMVPVHWPCGMAGQALVTVPLKAGDDVTLHFSERALEDWLSGTDGPPGDPRQFDLSDAYATPVMRPGVTAADTVNVSVSYSSASIKITPAGGVLIVAPGGYDVQSPTYTHNGVNVGATHVHGGVSPGASTTSTPA